MQAPAAAAADRGARTYARSVHNRVNALRFPREMDTRKPLGGSNQSRQVSEERAQRVNVPFIVRGNAKGGRFEFNAEARRGGGKRGSCFKKSVRFLAFRLLSIERNGSRCRTRDDGGSGERSHETPENRRAEATSPASLSVFYFFRLILFFFFCLFFLFFFFLFVFFIFFYFFLFFFFFFVCFFFFLF